jgi:signal transduction histidine kinase
VRDESGAVVRIVGVAEDITDEKQREAELLQARKMEAVGRLTGEIAHDFNNLLTVIAGNAAMLEDASGADRADLVSGIQAAARRGADLTGRLLAFARKQPLRPAPTEVAEVLASATPMIERLIGERYRIQTSIAEDLPPIHVDAAQLDAAILNLAVNARDAMPQGGRIGIRARTTIRDGRQHVAIEVSDTGPGVPAEIRGQIFDPFFTTKETGKGTGLGLSTTIGIIKGQPFEPDARMTRLLTEAARLGDATARAITYNPRQEGARIYPDTGGFLDDGLCQQGCVFRS